MKSALRLSTQQRLAFTPQIQQTIRMLQLGVNELSEEIDETLKTNPLLKELKNTVPESHGTVHADWMENLPAEESESFEDYLINQLGFYRLDSEIYAAACIIISCLDDNGYLTLSNRALEDEFFSQNLSINRQGIESAINAVRQLEPAGIASVSLADCLKQQLYRYHKHALAYDDAVSICDHLELLAADTNRLKIALNLQQNSLDACLALIRQLYAAPADEFEIDTTVYIRPDILLSIDQNNVQVSINPVINRNIEINMEYVNLLKQSSKSDDRDYLKKNLNSARWWVNALAQRNITLLRVAEQMITAQKDYFTAGMGLLKPLSQQNIADSLNLHISTVSRAIKDKSVQTPKGIILLKSLLAGRIPANNDNYHSNQSVKVIIAELIKNESSQTPLSDSKITEMLLKRGIRIARRTVNKYREQLNIPASNLRRTK